MEYPEFELLSLEDQADITFAGEYISTIHYYGYRLSLYLVSGSFYIEVFYNMAENQIESFKPADPTRMDLYLDSKSLKGLL